jgi:hypothetical protein
VGQWRAGRRRRQATATRAALPSSLAHPHPHLTSSKAASGAAPASCRKGLWITKIDLLDKDVGFENPEPGEDSNHLKKVIMAFPVMIALFVGLIVGGAFMAIWAARRIGDEAARQFDRGFERGRWMADLSMHQGLDPHGSLARST